MPCLRRKAQRPVCRVGHGTGRRGRQALHAAHTDAHRRPSDALTFQGRFAELMSPHAPPADQQALARQLLDAMGLTAAVLGGTPFNN
ncbi:MAG: hypothetical protein KA191_08950 [Verrucomicrobia bacterium]|nr:hypothetical protein [Verrucomicrobiota bacterium]OQC67011.1 MAG: hypothetical protein BWX48_01083 [Verrucomicrobia bacterium ADurb.Bin006]MDI9382281.1 hypothetical protein [Verrucomicrobiota bacterium]NMD20152.1 hypothetical protein [Verrucomicrobiota bacterium]HNV00181.1 hypothetical protein [Verrucomicrobiota bacterium]